jgi:DNA-binding NarL/FixJ family response regulator
MIGAKEIYATRALPNDIEAYSILVIEDNPGDFALVEEFLFEQVKRLNLFHAKTYSAILSGENCHKLDVILLDLSLPDKTGTELINDVTALCNDTPVVILTGFENLSFGVTALSLGASDYILKDELTPQLLHKSILYSIERKKLNLNLLEHINAVEEQNKKLREIAWIQSHIVRAPLARMMGLMDLFKSAGDEKETIVDFLIESAHELDAIIQDITNKAHEKLKSAVVHIS